MRRRDSSPRRTRSRPASFRRGPVQPHLCNSCAYAGVCRKDYVAAARGRRHHACRLTIPPRRPPWICPTPPIARQRWIPTRNVVLEASAGTGKTRVLVDRYTNLLKARVDPANILAITFTRKAAAEMRERILHNLQSAAATGEIDEARWRDLRDRLGDIAISTIDAFCLSLLREFPLEADLDPGFTMADETEVLRLIDEGLDRALRVCRGIAATDPAVAPALRAARGAEAAGRPRRAARPAARGARRAAAVPRARPRRSEPATWSAGARRRGSPTRCGRSRAGSPPSSRTARGSIRASPCWPATSRRWHPGCRLPAEPDQPHAPRSPTACAITSSTTRASRARDGRTRRRTPTRPRRGSGTAIGRSGSPRGSPTTSRGSAAT